MKLFKNDMGRSFYLGLAIIAIVLFLLALPAPDGLSPTITSSSIVRLGPALGPVSLQQAEPFSSSKWSLFVYQHSNYCGKGRYKRGNQYKFGCRISLKIIANPVPKPSPAPYPTAQPQLGCPDVRTCVSSTLALMNQERASHNIPPLSIDWDQSFGSNTCIGAEGHSAHMALTGQLAHDQFPADICSLVSTAGENIGEAGSDEWSAIVQTTNLMLAEPWSNGCTGNHHCNIDYSGFTKVGIGFAQSTSGYWFITEDFLG